MGTIVYEYKSRIIELENEAERNNEKMGIMLCIAVATIALSISIVKSPAFFSAEPIMQSSIIGGTLLTAISAYMILSIDKKFKDVQTLFVAGLALTIIPMLSMTI